jgi:hypothetical protein
LLIGCTNKFSYSLDRNDILSIEIIEIDYDQPNLVYTTIYTLDENEIDDFIDNFSKVKFMKVYGDPHGFDGKCILIRYINNDFEIIGQKYIERRNINNEVVSWHYYHADKNQFDELINIYN